MALILSHYPLWPASQGANVALLEQGCAFTVQPSPPPTTPWISPLGNPPVLDDTVGPSGAGPVKLWDLTGIAWYIHVSPKLIPPDPCQAPATFAWASWTRAVLTPYMETMLLHGRILPMAARDPAKMMPALTAFRAALAALEPCIPPVGKYINHYGTGNGCFSLADVALGTCVTFAHLVPAAKLDLATAYPNVSRYQTMLELRTSFLTALTNVTLGTIPSGDMLVFP